MSHTPLLLIDYKVKIASLGGIEAIIKAMSAPVDHCGVQEDHCGVQEQACGALLSLASSDGIFLLPFLFIVVMPSQH